MSGKQVTEWKHISIVHAHIISRAVKSIRDPKMLWDFPGCSWHEMNQCQAACTKLHLFILSSLEICVDTFPDPFMLESISFRGYPPNNTPKPSFVQRRKKGGAENAARTLIGQSACQSNAGTEKGGGGYTRVGSRFKKAEKRRESPR